MSRGKGKSGGGRDLPLGVFGRLATARSSVSVVVFGSLFPLTTGQHALDADGD